MGTNVGNKIFIMTVTVKWDVERWADKVKAIRVQQDSEQSASDFSLAKYFPVAKFGNIIHPAVIVDIQGRIITWHLPGALTASRVVCVFLFLL